MSKESKELIVSQVHTTCRNCVFADFEGKTQTGCKLEKLKDYKNAGVEILKAEDEKGYKFDIINGRFCMFYRNEEVMAKHPKDNWEKIVLLQNQIPYQAIVFFEESNTLKDLMQTINSLKRQYIKPNIVTIINKQYHLYKDNPEYGTKPSEIYNMLASADFHQYTLKNVYNLSLTDRDLIDTVFDVTKEKPLPFYVTFKAGFYVDSNFSRELNDAIFIKMIQLGFASPVDDINGMIVNKIAHKKHAGNSFGVDIEKKILKYEDNGKDFIFKAGEICPSLNKS